MRAGELRQRATLQSRSSVRDALGGESVIWGDEFDIWCCIEPLQGRELLAAQQIQSEINTRITVRYYDGKTIVPQWRLVHDGVIFDILTLADIDTRHNQLVLMCIQGLKDG